MNLSQELKHEWLPYNERDDKVILQLDNVWSNVATMVEWRQPSNKKSYRICSILQTLLFLESACYV